ncbi:MAG TPA: MFS transporter [Actinomycetota bacterium]|jgi:predicted MFS family arabinose efflux permease|nr:MFS transporter [Actinomycetota bacterium]
MVNEPQDGPSIPEETIPEIPRPHPDPAPFPRLLAIRPFLWLVLGEGLANLGLWSFFVAVEGEAAFRFDATPSQFGILLSSYSVVFIIASPGFGVLADRWSPKHLMVTANGANVLFLLVALWAPSLPWLYLATALFGLAEAATHPARGALVPLLVDEQRLVQANGMMALAEWVPLIVGPAIAGLVVHVWGPDSPYLVAMASIALSLLLYGAIPDRRKPRPEERESFLAELAGGFREGWKTPILRAMILRAGIAYALLGLVITLETLYIRESLHRGQDFLAFVWAVSGVGAALGAAVLARIRQGAGREHSLIALGLTVGGVGYVLYVGTSVPAIAAIGSFFFAAGFALFSSPAQALIQRVATQPGQVTAVYGMLSEGGPLATSLLVAVIGGLIAVQPWLVIASVLFILLGLFSMATASRWSDARERSVSAGADISGPE